MVDITQVLISTLKEKEYARTELLKMALKESEHSQEVFFRKLLDQIQSFRERYNGEKYARQPKIDKQTPLNLLVYNYKLYWSELDELEECVRSAFEGTTTKREILIKAEKEKGSGLETREVKELGIKNGKSPRAMVDEYRKINKNKQGV